MIKTIINSNIFNSKCEALVNTVNCVGVMGAGLALQFKNKFPDMFVEYKAICQKGLLKPGQIHFYPATNSSPHIINFPTKNHWKNPSQLEYIESGLIALLNILQIKQIKSVAIPPLGCGLGGLDWKIVKQMIIDINWNNINIEIYEPKVFEERKIHI